MQSSTDGFNTANTFGNGGVHYLDTDGSKTQDIGLFRNFNFTETKRLQFREPRAGVHLQVVLVV